MFAYKKTPVVMHTVLSSALNRTTPRTLLKSPNASQLLVSHTVEVENAVMHR